MHFIIDFVGKVLQNVFVMIPVVFLGYLAYTETIPPEPVNPYGASFTPIVTIYDQDNMQDDVGVSVVVTKR